MYIYIYITFKTSLLIEKFNILQRSFLSMTRSHKALIKNQQSN